MADLKLGTTIGGSPVWNQGNFPLFPAGDSVLYKSYKVYTEKDKPQAVDNDFVSKASGGVYSGRVTFDGVNSTSTMTSIIGQTPGVLFQAKDTPTGAPAWSYQIFGSTAGAWRFRVGATAGSVTDIFTWTDTTKSFNMYGNIRLSKDSGYAFYDATGLQVYSPQNRPTPAAIGAVALDAVVDFGTY